MIEKTKEQFLRMLAMQERNMLDELDYAEKDRDEAKAKVKQLQKDITELREFGKKYKEII